MEAANEEIRKLAESLRSSGLAASDLDAVNKATEILGYSNKGVGIRVNKEPEEITPTEEPPKPVQSHEEITPTEEPPKPVTEQENNLNKFNDPTFNVAQSGMNLNEIKEEASEPVQTQENQNVVRTNEEIQNQPQPNIEQPKESVEEEKTKLSEKEKEETDLSKLFNFGNR
jgi:hypothetical protein